MKGVIKVLTVCVCLTAAVRSAALEPAPDERFVLRESGEWVHYFQKKDIKRGTALDFSEIVRLDAPAGKYGWLKSVGNHFEFENLPGVEQRFLGVNLCNEANYPTHSLADSLVIRFVRMGYNSIRVHHHDNLWRNAENQDRLDYFLAKAIEAGMYITTDMYVSRKVMYRDMGIDKPGTMSQGEYKALVSVSKIGFKDWCDFSGEFLNHVNTYTGRAYKDEPALCLISLVNEGCMEHQWKWKKDMDKVLFAWRKFGGKGEPKPGTKEFSAFSDNVNESTFLKCSEFVRSIGCKALLTNDNNGGRHSAGAPVVQLYDYVDKHIYVNSSVKKYEGQKATALNGRDPSKRPVPWYFEKNSYWGGPDAGKPYVFSEWRHCFPSHSRAVTAVMGLAQTAIRGIDGLWPFAYAERMKALYESSSQSPRSFDLALDGLTQGLVPAEVFFYLRGDVTSESQISCDSVARTCCVIAESSEMVYAENGFVKGEFQEAEISGAPSVIFVGAVDGKPLCESARLILTHLTDVQGNGSEWGEEEMINLLAFGYGQLIRSARASLKLHLSNPSGYAVYEIDGSGERQRKIDSSVIDGGLAFDISTNGPDGGRICYEICRE